MQSASTDSISNSQEQDQQLRAQVELLRNPDAGSPSHSPEGTKREPVNETGSPDAAAGTNAFDQHHQQPAPGPGAAPIESAGSHQRPEAESFIHPDLRAAHASHVAAAQQAAGMMPMDPPTGHSPQSSTNTNQSPPPPPNSNNPGASLHNTANPPPQQTHNANLAPAPPPQGQPQPPQQPQHVQHHPGAAGLQDPVSPDGRARPKRELSQSKRAAQNRAAQRAFRQRKETYIRELEQENKMYQEMDKAFKALQTENFSLREYVITLQSRLIDVEGGHPPPPPNLVDLAQPHGNGGPSSEPPAQQQQQDNNDNTQQQQQQQQQQPLPPAPSNNGTSGGTPLEAVARAVAGLAAQEDLQHQQHQYGGTGEDEEMKDDQHDQDTRTADEINRHLQGGEAETAGVASV